MCGPTCDAGHDEDRGKQPSGNAHKIVGRSVEKVGIAEGMEKDTLEFENAVDERSRLCCQIEMSDELDGLTVEVAPF